MRVDRGGAKGFSGETARSGKETSIQKTAGKVKLTAGDQDDIQITQNGNSLRILINQSDSVLLNPEESKNLEIAAGAGNISVDGKVTIPIKGHHAKADDAPPSKVDTSGTKSRQEETALTAKITRNFLSSELQNISPASVPDIPSTSSELDGDSKNEASADNVKTQFQNVISDQPSEFRIRDWKTTGAVLSRSAEMADPRSAPLMSVSEGVDSRTSMAVEISDRQSSSSTQMPQTTKSGRLKLAEMSGAQSAAPGTKISEASAPSVPAPAEISDQQSASHAQFEETIDSAADIFVPQHLQMLELQVDSMTPEQKTNVIQNALAGRISTASDEMILSVLGHAENPEEFSAIVDKAGGKKIATKLEGEEARVSWDRLVVAYDRLDLSLHPHETIIGKGVLTKAEEALQKYVPGAEEPLWLQIDGLNGHLDLTLVGGSAARCAVLENVIRESIGSPLIVVAELRERVFDILNDPQIDPEERPLLLEALRKDVNLTEFQMREMISLPFVSAFESALRDLGNVRGSKVESFQKEIRDAIQSYGPESVAVEIVKAEESESLGIIDPQIQLFKELKAVASEIFSGPSDPLVKADRVIHGLLTAFIPPQTELATFTEKITHGATLFQTGKLDHCLQKIDRLNSFELKPLVASGIQFLNALPVVAQILAEFPVRELKPFQFLQDLRHGTFQKQVQQFGEASQQFVNLPPLQQSVRQLSEWRNQYQAANVRPDRKSLLTESHALMENLTGGILQARWKVLENAASDLKLDLRISAVIDSVKAGRDLIVSLRNGHLANVLASLNQRMAGSPAVLQIIQQGLHLTTAGSTFFRGLFNRDWDKPIVQALKKSPGNKELTEAHGMFTDTLNLFLPLESIDHLNPFVQYQKQLGLLKDEAVLRDLIHQYKTF